MTLPNILLGKKPDTAPHPPQGVPAPKPAVTPVPPKLSEAERQKLHDQALIQLKSFIKSMDALPPWMLTYIELHIRHIRAHREDLIAEEAGFKALKEELEQLGYQVDVKGMDPFTDIELEE
jgi:hypothetical protein